VRAVRLLERPLVAAPLLMSTSVGRARHDRATPGSPTRTGAPTTARGSTLQSLGCGSKYEPAFLVAHPADPRPRTLPSRGETNSPCIRGGKSRRAHGPRAGPAAVDRVLAKYRHVIEKLADGRSCGKAAIRLADSAAKRARKDRFGSTTRLAGGRDSFRDSRLTPSRHDSRDNEDESPRPPWVHTATEPDLYR